MEMVAGDLLPAMTIHLYDGAALYDASGADAVHIKAWQDQVLLFDRSPSTITPGTVTLNWVSGDTANPGPIEVKVVVMKNGFKPASFPPRGFMTVIINPASP